MRQTMQRHDRTDHVPVVDLVSYEDDDLDSAPDRKAAVEVHLLNCSACSEDLAALRGARRHLETLAAETAPATLRPRVPALAAATWKRAFFAAAAASVLLAVMLFREPPITRAPLQMTSFEAVTFAPTVRGDSDARALQGPGPWAITLLLPFGAPEGGYAVSVLQEDGEEVPGLVLETTTKRDGRLEFLLQDLPGAGDYRLRAVPLASPPSEAILYGFHHSDRTAPESR
jgi:hypothetical protein